MRDRHSGERALVRALIAVDTRHLLGVGRAVAGRDWVADPLAIVNLAGKRVFGISNRAMRRATGERGDGRFHPLYAPRTSSIKTRNAR